MNTAKEKNYYAALLLQDGTVFHGKGFGHPKKTIGEVVFNTGMVGYTEALTDPSYKGQLLTFTYPLIGNYGVPTYSAKDEHGIPINFESDRIQTQAAIIHELCETPSHWASTKSLDAWLNEEGIPGISAIDTRALTKKLRVHGVMMGALEVSPDPIDLESLKKTLSEAKAYGEQDFVREVSCTSPITYGKGRKTVAVIDCGVKYGIIRQLVTRGFNVTRFPYDTPADTILSHHPDGVLVSNGPGDPKTCSATVRTVSALLESGLPVLGICLGVQIIALALGGETYKLKFGHRGQNKPCTDLETGLSYVTSQNHGYAVQPDSLPDTGLKTWFINADDCSIEGLKHDSKPCIAVQFHPEASPGPYDTSFVFDDFREMVIEHH
ncbi:MAG: glutamine-hydrolyzing carbamoyl-phosphate synthase small subunit [Thaumarchaeota archaeon]|nr:glutamine-hydrolyzing carbamoyl-phosphate synthase small subunit [Nitrososphaerota archaeon]